LYRLGEADNGNLIPFANFVANCVERSLDIYLLAFEKEADTDAGRSEQAHALHARVPEPVSAKRKPRSLQTRQKLGHNKEGIKRIPQSTSEKSLIKI